MKDFITENNPAWRTIIAGNVPEWFEKSAAVSEAELSALAATAFADPVHRLHPMHTKSAAFSSLAYLLTIGAEPGAPEVQTLKQAAALHGVTAKELEDLDTFAGTIAVEAVKSASAGAPRAALTRLNDGVVEHYMGLSSVGEVMGSAEELAGHYADGKMPVSWACEAAGNIKAAAAAFGLPLMELHPVIGELTDPACFDYEMAMQLVGHRKLAGCDAEAIANYESIVQAVAGETVSAEEGAELIEVLDKAHNVKYAFAQRRPWDILHAGPSTAEILKMANANVVIGGVMVPAHVVAGLPDDTVKMRFAGTQAETVLGLVKDARTSPAIATTKCANLSEDLQRAVLSLVLDESSGLTLPDMDAA